MDFVSERLTEAHDLDTFSCGTPRLVVVDAIDEAASLFYEHYGFRRIPDTGRLVQKMSAIGAALGH